ncbi:hypothetical Protein YC6258_05288 [Gynuella sunshinyii YC6258]|uniref:Uncharacterized protein n=1 Tax=Gynuella sunshinyii YC6258 TaxID=1445510 RepID=A0A0C5VVK1_9GAMM|nr:hypothetical Protein YC6258_05288 [Gynuella sunshinyii YC6258]
MAVISFLFRSWIDASTDDSGIKPHRHAYYDSNNRQSRQVTAIFSIQ